MRHRLLSLLAVTLAMGCGDALAPDGQALDPPAFAKVTGTFPNSDCQFSQKGNKVKLLNNCTTTNLSGIALAPGTKFDGKKHTVTTTGTQYGISGNGGSFEVKHVNIECSGTLLGMFLVGVPDRSKIKVEHVHVSGCGLAGIDIRSATHGSKISHNHVDGGLGGVHLEDSDKVKVDHNQVAGADIANITLNTVQDSKVSHNTLSGTGKPCLEFDSEGNKWKKNKNLTGNPSDPPELCPL